MSDESNERQIRRFLRTLETEAAEFERKLSVNRESAQALEKVLAAMDTRPSISEEKLNKVETYLLAHPGASQVEIAKQTKMNSGSVSVALKRLEVEGKAEPTQKNGRSQAWAPVTAAVA